MNTIKHRAENLNNGGSVTVYYCGYEKCEGGHFWGPAVRNQYLLHYVISGKGTYTVGEETYTLHANECFLIRPGERTYYIADREDPWEYMWVAFDGFVSQYTTKLENGDEFIRYMHEMIDEFNKGSLFKVMSGFYGAMSVLEESAHGGAYTREHEYVNKAIGYIKSNYGYPIQISDLARHIGIDRTYLYRIFSASESMSPKQYLMQVRINAAKKMLLAGFKRCTGMTPKEFVAASHKQKSSSNT